MTISAKMIADSISEENVRLTTLQLCYPRFIHAEFMTHRVFSRNASSSRAIPVAKMIEQVRSDPAMPIHWGANQPGMQASNEIANIAYAKNLWIDAANSAADYAENMMNMGLHKQVANRILEPFQHIHVIVTATDWANFFELRAHPDAQPEIHELALQMKAAMDASTPTLRKDNEWHLPYVTDNERNGFADTNVDYRKVSAARCARVSYLTHAGQEPDIAKDIALYDRLVTSKPAHASPVEHQATPDNSPEYAYLHGNFTGWVQFRKLIEHGLL